MSNQNKINFTDEEKRSITQLYLKTKEGELADRPFIDLFFQTCERTGLSPYSRQIMASSRNTRQKDGSYKAVWSTLVTIDGLRAIAEATGEYEGQDGPWWCGEDGVWTDIWTKKTPPFACKVQVYRRGFRMPMNGVARFEAYAQTNRDGSLNEIWKKLGDHMNAKVAEALGLRKAFPQQLGGLYTTDEMAQAGIVSEAQLREENAAELQAANAKPEPRDPAQQPQAAPAPVAAQPAAQQLQATSAPTATPVAQPAKPAVTRGRSTQPASAAQPAASTQPAAKPAQTPVPQQPMVDDDDLPGMTQDSDSSDAAFDVFCTTHDLEGAVHDVANRIEAWTVEARDSLNPRPMIYNEAKNAVVNLMADILAIINPTTAAHAADVAKTTVKRIQDEMVLKIDPGTEGARLRTEILKTAFDNCIGLAVRI